MKRDVKVSEWPGGNENFLSLPRFEQKREEVLVEPVLDYVVSFRVVHCFLFSKLPPGDKQNRGFLLSAINSCVNPG